MQRSPHHPGLVVCVFVVGCISMQDVSARGTTSKSSRILPRAGGLVVTNTSDSGAGSLRDAIANANAIPGPDTITFAIPAAGVQTITPTTALPTITEAVTIDGYTQPGSSPNTLTTGDDAVILIEINGISAGPFTVGLYATAGSTTIRGLAINRFNARAISLRGIGGSRVEGCFIGTDPSGTLDLGNGTAIETVSPNNTIGGVKPAERNILSGNNSTRCVLIDNGTGNLVQGNYIGTDKSGTAPIANNGAGVEVTDGGSATIGGLDVGAGNVISANRSNGVFLISPVPSVVEGNLIGLNATGTAALPNLGSGVQVNANGNTIGGTTAAARNVLSGNHQDGVLINGGSGNMVQGNRIGTNPAGTVAIGNSGVAGVLLNGAPGPIGNMIGGSAPGAGNLISGNRDGVQLNTSAVNTKVQGNLIGTQADGTSPLGNTRFGIDINNGKNTSLGGTGMGEANVIAFNGSGGVYIVTTGNAIRANSIHDNGGLGIDLNPPGIAQNDAGDADRGANNLQNYPVITSVSVSGLHTTVSVMQDSAPANSAYPIALDFYASPTADPSGFGEGKTYLGALSIPAPGFFSTATLPAVAAGQVITATATDSNGNTSEFSRALPQLGASAVVINTNDAGPGSLRAAIDFANAHPGAMISFNIAGSGIHTIRPSVALPDITASGVTIDGRSQPGFTVAPLIVIAPVIAVAGQQTHCIAISGAHCTIRALVLNANFTNVSITGPAATGNKVLGCYIGLNSAGTAGVPCFIGVSLATPSTHNTIGGTSAADRNVIAGNNVGVSINGAGATDNTVSGNFIGTTVSGNAAGGNGGIPFGRGIWIQNGAKRNVIGGTTPGAGNLIAGNTGTGIDLVGVGTEVNLVEGNTIGLRAVGSALGNGTNAPGVLIEGGASNNQVGGTIAGARNVIAGNGTGLLIQGVGTIRNSVRGNTIGSATVGSSTVGNTSFGVRIVGASANTIGGVLTGEANIIAGNGGDGISVSGAADNNALRGNSIHDNARLGINLVGGTEDTHGVTANDVLDADTGPDNLQNFPVISQVSPSGARTIISGTLNTRPSAAFTLDFYRNTRADLSGHGEGEVYLGSQSVTTASSGSVAFSFPVNGTFPGQFFTATATDSAGNTSEFGLNQDPPTATVATSVVVVTGFSNASATAGSVTLLAAAALDATSAADTTHYSVVVAGRSLTVESAAYDTRRHAVLLGLAEGALNAGDHVVVRWSGLRAASGAALADGSVTVVARSS